MSPGLLFALTEADGAASSRAGNKLHRKHGGAFDPKAHGFVLAEDRIQAQNRRQKSRLGLANIRLLIAFRGEQEVECVPA